MAYEAANSTYGGNITIWPEWTENDLLLEKWDIQGPGSKSSKDTRAKGSSFEDPDGKVRLPPSLACDVRDWRRPQEIFGDYITVVRNVNKVNLREANQHLERSEFVRYFCSFVTLLWYNNQKRRLEESSQSQPDATPVPATVEERKTPTGVQKESKHVINKESSSLKTSQHDVAAKSISFEDPLADWAPWNLIYAGPPPAPRSAAKGETVAPATVTNLPQYNSNGKYAVRLFWMGSWRKVIVDDLIPVDEDGLPLLPVNFERSEIWPIILCKAVLKVTALEPNSGPECEFGDPLLMLHLFTGWMPYAIQLDKPNCTRKGLWNKLQSLLPLNNKKPIGDIVSAAAVNWSVQTARALERWMQECDPEVQEGIELIRMERLQTTPPSTPATAHTPVAQTGSTSSSGSSMLAPKAPTRAASARNTSANPRKLDPQPPGSLTPGTNGATEFIKLKPTKVPEILIFCSYRSQSNNGDTARSTALYNNGFLRSESHPFMLFSLRDVHPLEPAKETARDPFRALTEPPNGTFPDGQHGGRAVQLLSLYWRAKGRLVHQTKARAQRLAVGSSEPTFKPTEGFEIDLDPLPECVAYPMKKEPRPPPTPQPVIELPPEDKPKGTKGEGGRDVKNQPAEPLYVPPPPAQPAHSVEELQSYCRLSASSIGFNQLFDSVETMYIVFKPETFDYQSMYSFYQPNVSTDGKQGPSKKKAGDQSSAQYNNAESPRAVTAKGAPAAAQYRYGKIPTYLPSPYLMVDNPYPSVICLSLSTFSRWMVPAKPDPKSQDRMSIVATNTNDSRDQEQPVRVVMSVVKHDWLSSPVGAPMATLTGTSCVACSVRLPAGRHILRLKVTSTGLKDTEPLGLILRAHSRDPVTLGNEETILKLTLNDSYQFSMLARRALYPILRWWKLNGQPTFTHPPYREIWTELGIEDELQTKDSRCLFAAVTLRAVYTSIQMFLREFCAAKTIFALRVFFGDVATTSVLTIAPLALLRRESKVFLPSTTTAKEAKETARTEQMAGKPETVQPSKKGKGKAEAGSPTKGATQPTAAAERASAAQTRAASAAPRVDLTAKIAATQKHEKAIVLWGLYFMASKMKSIIEARKSSSKRKEGVIRLMMDMLEAVLKSEQLFACCFLRTMCRLLPPEWVDLGLLSDQEIRYVYKDISSNCPEIPPNTHRLMFRDHFAVNESVTIAFKVITGIPICRVSVVDNDTGLLVPDSFSSVLPRTYEKNEKGYTVVVEARSGNLAWKPCPWTLRVIQCLDPLAHESSQADSVLVKFAGVAQSNFLTREISDYFLPDVGSNLIGRAVIRIRNPSTVTIVASTSNPDVYFETVVYNSKGPMCRYSARGFGTIPSLALRPQSNGQNELFYVELNLLEQSWPLSGDDWRFVYTERNRRVSLEAANESPVQTSVSPVRSAPKELKKSAKQTKDQPKDDKPEVSKDGFESARQTKGKEAKPTSVDPSRPSWTIKFILDPSDLEFEFKRDTEQEESLRRAVQTSVSADPSTAQRGREFREGFLRMLSAKGFITPDSSQFRGWITGTAEPVWLSPKEPCPEPSNLSAILKKPSGDSPQEWNLHTVSSRVALCKRSLDEAVQKKLQHLQQERVLRQRAVQEQGAHIRRTITATITARRKYAEWRDRQRAILEELAIQEAKAHAQHGENHTDGAKHKKKK